MSWHTWYIVHQVQYKLENPSITVHSSKFMVYYTAQFFKILSSQLTEWISLDPWYEASSAAKLADRRPLRMLLPSSKFLNASGGASSAYQCIDKYVADAIISCSFSGEVLITHCSRYLCQLFVVPDMGTRINCYQEIILLIPSISNEEDCIRNNTRGINYDPCHYILYSIK